MDRNSRRLSHGKGNKIITQSEPPISSQGDDGDQLMVGSTLYTKSQGNWVGFKSIVPNIEEWITMTLLNNWANFNPSYMDAAYLLDEMGFVHLRGTIKNFYAGSHNTNEIICILPPLFRPHKRHYALVPYDGDNSRRLLAKDNGEINLPTGDALTSTVKWTSIDNVNWWVGKDRLRQL